MIVAAESNFVLETTFRQSEANECERLIELAEKRAILLAIPACSLFEPYETLVRRNKQRDDVLRRLENELRDLTRSQPYAHLQETSGSVLRALKESGKVHAIALNESLAKIVRVATIIPLSAEVMHHAMNLRLSDPLTPQDAVVFASVDLYMRNVGKGPKVFANKNRRDFLTDEVDTHFQQYDCRVLESFAAARQLSERTNN